MKTEQLIRVEQSKSQIENNMKTLNTLLNDYTAKTHDAIHSQLNQPSHSVRQSMQCSPLRFHDSVKRSVGSIPSVMSIAETQMPARNAEGTDGPEGGEKEKAEEMDDTEAFITHSDHMDKGEPNDDAKFCKTGVQP